MNFKFIECGGIFELPEGRITSPKYPLNYDNNLYCEWIIRVEPSHTISLVFTDFDLEQSSGCTSDYLQVSTDFNKIIIFS